MTIRIPLTEEQKIERTLARVAKLNAKFDTAKLDMPEGFSVGYIGNCSTDVNNNIIFDDRSWHIIRESDFVKTHKDCIGGYSTEERYKLLKSIHAIKFALNLV
jgi:hypothetical protein|tara:strand:- start:1009 stop:1317 length:309 start_codon:yes stop_codon:yes gene_type:complete